MALDTTHSKIRITVTREILEFLKPFLDTAARQRSTFIDWFYDTPGGDLLSKGIWLLRRDSGTGPDQMWKLQTSEKPDNTQFYNEAVTIQSLQELGFTLSSLPGPFQCIYMDIYTIRYHLAEGLWVDFAGWYPYEKRQDAAVYAVCCASVREQDATAQRLLDQIKTRTSITEDAPSRKLVMLAHDKPELLAKVSEHSPEALLKFVHSGDDFAEFDHYLGQEQGWKDFPDSD